MREQRRKNLAHEIETAGVILANKIDDINKRVEISNAERAKLMADAPNVSVIKTMLFRTGDEQKQLRHHGLQEAISGISNTFLFAYKKQVEAVRDAMRTAEKNKDRSRAETYRRQLTRMEATYRAAAGATSQMRSEANAIYNEVVEA